MLSKHYKLYAKYPSGKVYSIPYCPDSNCDQETVYVFIRGKFVHSVNVSELVLNYEQAQVDDA